MKYHPFVMERWQSTYEHRVRINLSESGVHPLSVTELLALADWPPETINVRLGYGQSNGSDELRNLIAKLYPGATEASVLVTIGGAEANFTAFWELMQPEASVAVMLPNYMQVPGLLESFGAPCTLAEGSHRNRALSREPGRARRRVTRLGHGASQAGQLDPIDAARLVVCRRVDEGRHRIRYQRPLVRLEQA